MLKNGSINEAYEPLQHSNYHQYMKRWLQTFSLQQIHIADGDQLIADPYKELKKIEKFLGLRHKITRGKFHYDKKKGFYCLKPDRPNQGCLSKSKGHKHPQIKPEVLQKLKSYFAPLSLKFYEQIHRNFTWQGETKKRVHVACKADLYCHALFSCHAKSYAI